MKTIDVAYTNENKEWSLAQIQDVLGEQLKEAVIVSMDALNKKLKLYEKYDFFKSNTPRYKYVVKKDLDGNIIYGNRIVVTQLEVKQQKKLNIVHGRDLF